MLVLENASMSFGRTRALDRVSLGVNRGEIRALLGENGSGKSTLIKILAGYHTPELGARLWLGGEEIPFPVTLRDLKNVPLNFVHQDLALSVDLSIVDNFAAARWRRERRVGLTRIQWRRERERARRALREFGLDRDVNVPVRDLREGERAIVALARALSTTPEDVLAVFVLDEATASLPRQEVGMLFDAIRTLKKREHAVIFVSHRLEEVRAIADTVSVLRDGRLVFQGELAATDDAVLVKAIIGHELEQAREPEADPPSGQIALSVRGVTTTEVRDVSFDVQSGEAVGLTGIAGMGQDALPDALLGLAPLHSGEIRVGDRGAPRSPRAALRAGIVYLPPSRTRGGALLSATVTETITMPVLTKYFRRGFVDRRAERADAVRLMEMFDVRPRQADALMSALSGGNQQKALLAKLQNSGAKILVLHEPTHGVDVGAREQVLEKVNDMKAHGHAILIISTEYEDLERLCDRVLIFGDGTIQKQLTGAGVTERSIAAACMQVSETVELT